MSGVKVRLRRDGKEERWQVDFPVLLPGALKTVRKRYTAPLNVTSKSGAVRWAEAMRRELEAGRPVPQSREGRAAATKKSAPAPAPLTLRDGVDIYLADLAGRGAALSTARLQRQNLRPFVERHGDRPLAEVGEAEASDVRAAMLSASYAASTINAGIDVYKIALRRLHALRKRGPVEDEIQHVKSRREEARRAYDDGTYEAMVAAAAKPEHLALVLLTGEAALRIGEVIGLDVGDVDLERRELHVRRSVSPAHEVTPPKTGKARVVPMTSRLAAALEPLVDGREADGPLLPGGSRIGRRSRFNLRQWLGIVQRAVDVPEKGPHALRHTAATSALAAGADPVAVQHLLGHARLRTTVDMYAHATGGDAARATSALERGRAQIAPVTNPSRAPQTRPIARPPKREKA